MKHCSFENWRRREAELQQNYEDTVEVAIRYGIPLPRFFPEVTLLYWN